MKLLEKLLDSFIVETEDQVYFDAENADEEDKELFINNLKDMCVTEEWTVIENMEYTDESFVSYLDEDPDDMDLAYKIIVSAWATNLGTGVDDGECEYEPEHLYYFNDNQDLHYEKETDIDLS